MKAFAIYLKELVDTVRDRRSLFSGLAYVLVGPLAVVFTVNVLAASGRDGALQPVALCGRGDAPALVEHLAADGLAFDADARICLDIPVDFAARLADSRPAHVAVRADLATTSATVRRLEAGIARYARTLAMQRLIARGIAPSVMSPVVVDTQNTNPVSRQADMIARLLIIFFVATPFFVSLAAAADATAGERERRALEPLLAHPVGAFSIVLGKWASAATIGVFGTFVCVFGGLAMLDHSALAELGVRLDTGPRTGAVVVAMLTPLCLLVAAAQLLIGLAAKNFKDAQSYLTLFSFVPVAAGFVVSGERLAHAGVWPVAWELNALAGPLLGATTNAAAVAGIVGVELGSTIVMLAIAARRLRGESLLAVA